MSFLEEFMKLTAFPILIMTVALFVFTQACTQKDNATSTTDLTATTPQTSAPQEKVFELCDAHKLCANFRNSEAQCRLNQKEMDCKEFVSVFEKLAVKNDCKRKFDKDAVPSVWICDEDTEETAFPKLFERSAATLSKLSFPFAKKFYGSQAFRSTLDGAVAEEHRKNSENTKAD